MPRAQAPSEVLLRNFRSLLSALTFSPLSEGLLQQNNTLRVPDATEKEIGNRQNLFYYSSSILPLSFLTLLAISSHFCLPPLLLSTLSNLLTSALPFFFFFLMLASPPSFHLPLSVVPFLLTDLAIITCRLP